MTQAAGICFEAGVRRFARSAPGCGTANELRWPRKRTTGVLPRIAFPRACCSGKDDGPDHQGTGGVGLLERREHSRSELPREPFTCGWCSLCGGSRHQVSIANDGEPCFRAERSPGFISGRVMRRESKGGLLPVLLFAVGPLSGWRRLVFRPSRAHRLLPGRRAARLAAVPVAPVAVGTQEEHLPARGPAARQEPKAFHHGTRRGPTCGDLPRSGVRLAPASEPRIPARCASWAPQWLLGGLLFSTARQQVFSPPARGPTARAPVRSPGATQRTAGASDDPGDDDDVRPRVQLEVAPLSRGSR